MKITKHAQSCFLIESDRGSRILIDPGEYVFGLKETLTPDDFKNVDILIITHEHSDHFDIPNIKKIVEAKKSIQIFSTEALVEEIGREIGAKSEALEKVDKRGGLGSGKDITLTGVPSEHGPLPSGDKPPKVCGVLIEEEGGPSFYDPGDSIVLNSNADIIATPICGKVVLNIGQAKEQLTKLNPKVAIPIHYDNPVYPVDVTDFIEAMSGTGIDVRVLKDGETLEV